MTDRRNRPTTDDTPGTAGGSSATGRIEPTGRTDPTGQMEPMGEARLAFAPQPGEQVEPTFTQEMSGPGATGANVAYGNTQGNQGMRLDRRKEDG